ncbi:hypothetical protein CC2G_014457 [Coprinopsis cinerea AmutBmut pab1-1]|nr:hypothetical protein CC2G_014457 [Coprinopsis cinerea AmutBmut pab1-1]
MGYALAFKLDGSDPKFASNLSAVYFEQGRYPLPPVVNEEPNSPPVTDPLAIKLAQRFVKAKLNAIASGSLSLHDKRSKKKGKSAESNYPELQQVWEAWTRVKDECSRHSQEECKINSANAEKRLRALPIFRSALYPVLEYYRFGHDPTRSLFYGIDNRNQGEFNIDEKTFVREKWKSVAFLFGGSGDARHAFGTLIHFFDIWKKLYKLGKRGSDLPKIHLTLVDIHPAALARVMLVFAFIWRSMDTSAEVLMEIETTAFYVWSTIIMPDYCAKLVTTVAQEIIAELTQKTPKKLTTIWAVDEHTRARVLPAFEYWSKPLQKSMKKFYEYNGPSNAFSNLMAPKGISLARNERFQAMIAEFERMKLINAQPDPELPLYNNCQGEEKLYDDAAILLPPKKILSRHPNLMKYVKSGGKSGKAALQEEVVRDWRPNATLFDNNTTEHQCFAAPGGYPVISSADPFQTFNDCLNFVLPFREKGEVSLDQTGFRIIQQLFDSVRQTMDLLEGSITLEFLCSELYSGLPRLIAGDFGPRPASYPKKYLRMWLSNTPDYTGSVLSNLVYLVPLLQDSQQAMILWNCLLNPASFSTLRDICFNYTYLTPAEIRRYFNCVVRDEHRKSLDEFSMSMLPRTKSYSSTVSKKDLHHYLATMLLRAICCPKAGTTPFRVDEPTNLVSFFRLLVTLCQTIGCPSHWIGDFFQSIVNDTLTTSAGIFTGTLPVTFSQSPKPTPVARKVNLDPWQVEVETVLVSAKGALPFPVAYPARYASGADLIKTYTTTVVSTAGNTLETNHLTKTASLLFYKPGDTDSFIKTFPSRIHDLIEKKDPVFKGLQVQILSSLEAMDFETGKVSWKMSQAWYERMRKEGWNMIVFVTNQWKTVSKPAPASEWKDARDEVRDGKRHASTVNPSRNAEIDAMLLDLD